jgi:hypothetical protein
MKTALRKNFPKGKTCNGVPNLIRKLVAVSSHARNLPNPKMVLGVYQHINTEFMPPGRRQADLKRGSLT